MNTGNIATLWADGGTRGKNPSPYGIYWSVYCDEQKKVVVHEQNDDYHTNQDAEWCALRAALTYATTTFPTHHVFIYMDSRFVVNQWAKIWRVKIARHHRLQTACRSLAEMLPGCVVAWRPREQLVARLSH